MKTIHILNPAAGQGGALKYKALENAYVTKSPGDAAAFVKSCLENTKEDINFKVCGGDGTVNEVVSGIMASGSRNGYLSVIPTGTGNDLVRSLESGADVTDIDVLTVSGRYAVNAVNTGFDLEVVQKAAQYKKKPLISGSLAYILGVVSALCGRFGKHVQIDYTDKDGNTGSFNGECLLAVAANGAFYGGGFKASPAAELSDGLIDLMIVKKISRLQFISLVSVYKKGMHINKNTCAPEDKFKDIIIFKKCRQVAISGIKEICADGEVFETSGVKVGVLPRALKVITKDKEPLTV